VLDFHHQLHKRIEVLSETLRVLIVNCSIFKNWTETFFILIDDIKLVTGEILHHILISHGTALELLNLNAHSPLNRRTALISLCKGKDGGDDD
jgi:hypothetical protein